MRAFLIGLFLLTGIEMAAADSVRRPVYAAPYAYASEPEKVGCYWYRQRETCSRYCYREVDGRRFCQERKREAYPQGVVEETVVWGDGRMKLGRGLGAADRGQR